MSLKNWIVSAMATTFGINPTKQKIKTTTLNPQPASQQPNHAGATKDPELTLFKKHANTKQLAAEVKRARKRQFQLNQTSLNK